MTTNYMENEGTKKKYLAPLIVIMLCAVALTGAAYAATYYTTVTGNGNLDGDYVVIDLYDDGSGTAFTKFKVNGNAIIYSETDKTKSPAAYVAKVDSKTIEFTTHIMINVSDDLKDKTFTLSQLGTGDASYTNADITGTLNISNVQIKSLVEDNGSSVKDDLDLTMKARTYYTVTISCTVAGDENETFGSYDTFGDLTADVGKISNGTFTVKFSATEN